MRNKILFSIFAMACAPILGQAQSKVNYEASFEQRTVQSTTDQPLAIGNAVWIGSFDAGFDIASSSTDLVALNDAWNMLKKDNIRPLIPGGPDGYFNGEVQTTDPSFNNSQVWFWIFQTSDNTGPDEAFGNVLGYALFSGNTSDWLIPPQGLALPDNQTYVNSDMVNMAYHGSYDANYLMLQPVPEPSTWGMIFVGLGCLTLHLWRKQPPNPFRR